MAGLRCGGGEGRSVASLGPDACGVSDVGLVRENNEDYFCLAAEGNVLVVADGLGGLPGGEVASATAAQTAARYLAERFDPSADSQRVRSLLAEAFESSQRAVLDKAVRARKRGMATTLVAAWIAGGNLYCSHVGDVRAYVLRSGGPAELLTTDDTLAMRMVLAGQLGAGELRGHPARNMLTRAIGLREWGPPSFAHCLLSPGDVVLLCSDGLWDLVEEAVLAAYASRLWSSPRDGALGLVELALRRGGSDNVTVAVRRVGRPGFAGEDAPEGGTS
ncbi:MAG: serine/threonine-protein phosphatase [Candidatus Dadabacteria bacterium]|nr:MAG: serine/threonine-protein phosphatase [Candidatus Dadabacteria bacterium]